jgi:hypothetical protein
MKIKKYPNLNCKYFLILITLFAISFCIIQPPPSQQLKLIFSNGKSNDYAFSLKPQNQLSMIISEALGTTLNLSWYDVCLYNGSIVTKNNTPTTPVTLGVAVFPFKTNQSMLDVQKGLEILPLLDNEKPDKIERTISGEKIISTSNKRECSLHISASEGGFEYSLFLLATTTDPYGTIIKVPFSLGNIGTISPYPLDTGPIQESRQLNLNNTQLWVRPNVYAIIIKEIVFILLALGFYESISAIWKKLFNKK